MDAALRELLRQLAIDAPEAYTWLQRMLSGQYSRGELRALARHIIALARNHPAKAQILRALAMILRLFGVSLSSLGSAFGGTAAGGAAGGTATFGGTAGGTTIGGTTAGGTTTAGGAAATGGASAAAITAATIAAIAVLVVEIFSLINAISLLKSKKQINRVTDQINQNALDGLSQLRAARDAGDISENEYKDGVDQVAQAFSDALNQLASLNSECQDALDDNILIGIGEWFSNVMRSERNYVKPLEPENRYRVGDLGYDGVMDKFASISNETGMALSSRLADLRRSAAISAVQPALLYFQEQGMNEGQSHSYRNLCLKAARYFSTPGGDEAMAFWRQVYNASPSNTLARKQAILSAYCSHSDEASSLLFTAMNEDADPVVRVLSYEISGANLRMRYDSQQEFFELIGTKKHSSDNATRLGIVYSIAMMPLDEYPQTVVREAVGILQNLIEVEENSFIAGSALNVLADLTSESELGLYAPNVQERKEQKLPTKDELLRFTLNSMMALGDKDGFLILSEHPSKVDIGTEKVETLFLHAPYSNQEEILQVRGIGKNTYEAMAEAVWDNLSGYGANLKTLPSLPFLRQAVRQQKEKGELTKEDLLLVVINLLSQDGEGEILELMTEHPERVDVGMGKITSILGMAPFETIEDLDAVRGIGLKTIEAMAEGLVLNLEKADWNTNHKPSKEDIVKIKNKLAN